MEAVIPAAGRGSRLGALTDDQPKGLVEIAGQPLLAHVFDRAIEAGADDNLEVWYFPSKLPDGTLSEAVGTSRKSGSNIGSCLISHQWKTTSHEE